EGHGISVVPNSSFSVNAARVTFTSVQVYKNGLHGIILATNPAAFIQGTADNSVVSYNGFSGFSVEGNGNANLIVSRSVMSGNGAAGFNHSASSNSRVSGSTIAYNNAAWTGAVASFGDNDLFGNGSEPAAPGGIATKK